VSEDPRPLEGRRALLYLLVFAGAAALLAGLAEILALAQPGPGPYFNVALGTSVLIVSVLFLLPNPAFPRISPAEGAVSRDLPNPLTDPTRSEPGVVPSRTGPGDGTGSARTNPSSPGPFELPGVVAQDGVGPSPRRAWQVRPPPSDLGGGFSRPRNPEGVLATLDKLAEELSRPIPGAPPPEMEPGTDPPMAPTTDALDDEDLARPVPPARGPPLDSPPGTPQGPPGPSPLRLPSEEDLLQAVPALIQPERPGPVGPGSDGIQERFEEKELQAGLDSLRQTLSVAPNPAALRSVHAPGGGKRSRSSRGARPPRAREGSPSPDLLGPSAPHVSEEELQGMLSTLEERRRSPTAPAAPTTVGRRPWDPSPD
jgi:hypothetical protein